MSTTVKAYQILIWLTIWAGLNYFGFVGYALGIMVWIGITFKDVRTPALTMLQAANLSVAAYVFLPLAKLSLADIQSRIIQLVYVSKSGLILIGLGLAAGLCVWLYSKWRIHLFKGAAAIGTSLSTDQPFNEKMRLLLAIVFNKVINPDLPLANTKPKPQAAPYVVWLHVPFDDKDSAMALGAKWDQNTKKWYVMSNQDVAKLHKWLKI